MENAAGAGAGGRGGIRAQFGRVRDPAGADGMFGGRNLFRERDE
jgi:hypothetical protein